VHSRGELTSGPGSDVEAGLLRIALGRIHLDRVLDVGCGVGRMMPLLLALSTESVGMDLDRRALNEARGELPRGPGLSFVRASADHLPFREAGFSAVVMIRLYHRLRNPSTTLAEVLRVLKPGGRFVIAVVPRPTVGTLFQDVWTRVRGARGDPLLTFSRSERVEVTAGSKSFAVETLGLTRIRLRSFGFQIVRELGSGFEELPLLRRIPRKVWLRLGDALGRAPYFPSVFLVAERSGGQ
jgi:SAM-dependent methyltransferase